MRGSYAVKEFKLVLEVEKNLVLEVEKALG